MPNAAPWAILAVSATRVRSAIIARSFCASAASMWIMNGSASAPSSVTMNCTRCAISPAINDTSRLSQSSFATTMAALALRAAARASRSIGRRSKASHPLPVSTSTNSASTSKPSAAANRVAASRCASMPRPLLPWRSVETRR